MVLILTTWRLWGGRLYTDTNQPGIFRPYEKAEILSLFILFCQNLQVGQNSAEIKSKVAEMIELVLAFGWGPGLTNGNRPDANVISISVLFLPAPRSQRNLPPRSATWGSTGANLTPSRLLHLGFTLKILNLFMSLITKTKKYNFSSSKNQN